MNVRDNAIFWKILLRELYWVLLVSFFIVFSNPVHGSEATGEKVEFYFSIFLEYLVKHAPITN